VSAFDEIGYWSEIKLDIIREYATAYSRILAARRHPSLTHIYVDAFAGSGTHISRATHRMVKGSPLNALSVEPPFREFHFVDIDGSKVAELRRAVGSRPDVSIYEGDCNRILLDEVFPRAHYEDFRRALCLLDPYGLHLDWEVIETAGKLRTVDMFLNFPTMDMNMNVLWSDPDRAVAEQRDRLNRFWGDESWRSVVYDRKLNLLDMEIKVPGANDAIVAAFRERLKKVAGFETVPEALPMRNSTGAIVYYLVFGSQKPVASGIVEQIFRKYRARVR
jgi:three-Cys-motif partner protein